MARLVLSSARWRRTSAPRASRQNQVTWWPASMAAWPRASRKWVLPVPDGPHTTRFSWRSTHSRVRSARWVGAGIDEVVSSQASKVLPVGNPAALRRAGDRGALPAGELLGEQGSDRLRRVPSVALSRWPAGRGRVGACAGGAARATARRPRRSGSRCRGHRAEAFPRAGAALERVILAGGCGRSPAGCAARIDGEVAFVEAAESGGVAQRPVDPVRAVEARRARPRRPSSP